MKLYKAKEMAELLNLNVQTIYRLGRESKLEVVRIGRTIRFIEPSKDKKEDK